MLTEYWCRNSCIRTVPLELDCARLIEAEGLSRVASAPGGGVLQSLTAAYIRRTMYNVQKCMNRLEILQHVGLPTLEWSLQVLLLTARDSVFTVDASLV